MKKKIIFLLLLLVLDCYWISYSYATTTGIVSLQSNRDTIEKGEEIEITVNISDTKTAAFNFSLYFDDAKLEPIANSENSNVIGNRILFVWYDTTGGNGAKQGELTKFKFRAKEEGTATFTLEGEFYSETSQFIHTEVREKQIQIGKEESSLQMQAQEEQGTDSGVTNANLQVLRLNQEGITPSFEKDTYDYYLTVSNDVQDIDVLAISENPNASIEITGNTNLKEGLNVINIQVLSPDKTQKKVYTIQVTKTVNLELANTNLEILAVENALLNPPFDNSEIKYTTQVSNEAENVKILAVPENEQATVEITGKENLKEGNNLVTVLVTAQNGFTKKKYQVEIYKRNAEEEKKYQEEQAQLQDKLEEAYHIEELDTKSNENQGNAQTKKNENKIIWIAVAIVIVVGGIVLMRQ